MLFLRSLVLFATCFSFYRTSKPPRCYLPNCVPLYVFFLFHVSSSNLNFTCLRVFHFFFFFFFFLLQVFLRIIQVRFFLSFLLWSFFYYIVFFGVPHTLSPIARILQPFFHHPCFCFCCSSLSSLFIFRPLWSLFFLCVSVSFLPLPALIFGSCLSPLVKLRIRFPNPIACCCSAPLMYFPWIQRSLTQFSPYLLLPSPVAVLSSCPPPPTHECLRVFRCAMRVFTTPFHTRMLSSCLSQTHADAEHDRHTSLEPSATHRRMTADMRTTVFAVAPWVPTLKR